MNTKKAPPQTVTGLFLCVYVRGYFLLHNHGFAAHQVIFNAFVFYVFLHRAVAILHVYAGITVDFDVLGGYLLQPLFREKSNAEHQRLG